MTKHPPGSFYRHILRDAWKVMRTHKSLWVFGFFTSFLGVGGVYELLIQGTGKVGLTEDFGTYLVLTSLVPTGPELLTALRGVGTYNSTFILVVGLAAIAFFLLAVWVVISSQGALIFGVRETQKGRTRKFSETFSAGSEVFTPLFLLNIASRFAIAASFYLILSLMLLLLVKATLLTSLLYLIAFLVLMPLTVIIGFVTIYAAAYIVLDRKKLVDAIETAIALFRKYWLINLEVSLILFAINIAVSLGIGAVFTILAVMLLPLIVSASLLGANIGLWLALILAAFVALAVFVIIGAGLVGFQYSVWTLLFMRLHVKDHGGLPKIVRLIGHIFR